MAEAVAEEASSTFELTIDRSIACGCGGPPLVFNVTLHDTVDAVRAWIFEKTGVCNYSQGKLILWGVGKQLESGRSLGEYGLPRPAADPGAGGEPGRNMNTLAMTGRMRGCAGDCEQCTSRS